MDWDGLYKLVKCQNEEDLINTLTSQLHDLGVEYFGYFNLCSHGTYLPKIIGTYPDDWVEQYLSNNYVEIDPTIPLCLLGTVPIEWGFAKNLNKEKRQIEYWKEVEAYGLGTGVSVPIGRNLSQKVGIGCSLFDNDEKKFLKTNGKQLEVIANVFSQTLVDISNSAELAIKSFNLSNREIECGKWLCTGYTLEQIANKMHISERTVRFHVGKLREKLKANNREQVIVKLVAYNIVIP